MKRTVPLLIAACCGIVLIITAFVPSLVSWGETATVWFDILAAIAFVLGGGNLIKIHLKKVSDRNAGWAYSMITIVTFLFTLFIGMVKWGVPPAEDQEYFGDTFASVSVDELPESLSFTEPVKLSGIYDRDNLPDSVKRQLSWEQNEEGITSLSFRGWMQEGQKEELLEIHQNLQWQAAVELLAEKSSVPESLQGKIAYYANHQAISVTGVLTEDLQEQLLALGGTPAWIDAVSMLAEKSNQQSTLELRDIPPALQIPEESAESLKLQGNTIALTGPLTPAMSKELLDVFPRVRPMSTDSINKYVAQLENMEGGLTNDPDGSDQKSVLTAMLGMSWNADQLIVLLDEAGKSLPIKKTACELLAEKQSGVHELKTMKPASGPDVVLNEEQQSFLREKVVDPDYNLNNLGVDLKEKGTWIASQESALQKFLGQASTIGARNKLICLSLTNDGGGLSDEQFAFLLAPYRAEHLWNQQVHGLLVMSHEVKYPWSGAYLVSGSPFWFTYEYAFKPLTATMFSLLAFYVASAAFRAFRAKNFEAFLLLGTAFIILLGRTFAGEWLSSLVPDYLAALRVENITSFVMTVVNTAGNRAIMIGISLGIVSTSLKILLGVDRTYLGSGED